VVVLEQLVVLVVLVVAATETVLVLVLRRTAHQTLAVAAVETVQQIRV
jgi:hypothetical protein